jgi:hypothetical protein
VEVVDGDDVDVEEVIEEEVWVSEDESPLVAPVP